MTLTVLIPADAALAARLQAIAAHLQLPAHNNKETKR